MKQIKAKAKPKANKDVEQKLNVKQTKIQTKLVTSSAKEKVSAVSSQKTKKQKLVVDNVIIVSADNVQITEQPTEAVVLTDGNQPPVEVVIELTPEQLAKEEKKKAAKSARMYFNANTQAAIVAFQTTPEKKDRDKLYVKEILPAFEKLVENLINIHKFTSLHDTYDDLKNDCVNFLFETIGKFDGNRGTNAFSYFNVVAKNWLIIRTKQKAQRMKRSISLDDPDSMSANEHRIIEDHCIVPSQDVMFENDNTAKNIVKLLYEIRNKAKSENELICINSIITIFENINDVDMLNKSAVLVYMRELSGLTPKQLTTTLQNIKKQYRRLKIDPKFRIF